ncbi:hypothetical protein EBS57_06315, partial [bacterium]|nr:hypothetical protein [bacterium]
MVIGALRESGILSPAGSKWSPMFTQTPSLGRRFMWVDSRFRLGREDTFDSVLRLGSRATEAGSENWTLPGMVLDNVRIYNRALSDQEVAQLADSYQSTFTLTGSMSTPRYLHTATRLNDGRVLVVGGYDAGGRALSSAEIYNPSTGTWANTGGLRYARTDHQAVLLSSGKVLVFGGFDSTTEQSLSTAELYD